MAQGTACTQGSRRLQLWKRGNGRGWEIGRDGAVTSRWFYIYTSWWLIITLNGSPVFPASWSLSHMAPFVNGALGCTSTFPFSYTQPGFSHLHPEVARGNKMCWNENLLICLLIAETGQGGNWIQFEVTVCQTIPPPYDSCQWTNTQAKPLTLQCFKTVTTAMMMTTVMRMTMVMRMITVMMTTMMKDTNNNRCLVQKLCVSQHIIRNKGLFNA